jgi:hypothetical protein
MSCYEVPIVVLENRDCLRDWAPKALVTAGTNKYRKSKRCRILALGIQLQNGF